MESQFPATVQEFINSAAKMQQVAEHITTQADNIGALRFRLSQYETIIKLIILTEGEGNLNWSKEQLDQAMEDPRSLVLGSLEVSLEVLP